MTDSYLCKNNCIDQNMTFCPSVDHRSGECYSANDEEPIPDGCSNNIVKGPNYMKYWYCNYNRDCTSNYQVT